MVTLTENLIVANAASGVGSYELSGGSVSTVEATVGNLGVPGELTHSGGRLTVRDRLAVGNLAGSEGICRLSGSGELSAGQVINRGEFYYSGGSFTGDLTNEGLAA